MKRNLLKKSMVSLFVASLLFNSAHADCSYELFTISSSKGTTVSEFIDQLSTECGFSVIVTDPIAEEFLQKSLNKTNLKNLTIEEVLNIILSENNLSYILENNILKVSYIQTKTFNINYIISVRKSKGSTDITLSSSSGQQGGGGGGGLTATTYDNSKGEAETGVKIESEDEVVFWKELDLELQQVLNRPEDAYKSEAPIINKNAGLITVSATSKQLKRLEAYLHQLQSRMKYQVLIDVHLFGIEFEDATATGIDWSQLYALQNFTVASITNLNSLPDSPQPETPGQGTTVAIAGAATINEVLKFLKTQGKTHAISNPKILTLNNQPALITVGTEFFYKIKQASQQQGAGGGVVATVENDVVNSVFAGVLLDITPEISDSGEITLKINPSISETREDLASDIQSAASRDMPPDLNRRQLASVVTVKDGNRVILGGLISTRDILKTNKVPLLGDIPGLGYLFKRNEKSRKVEELVIILEPHIIKQEGGDVTLADLGYEGISKESFKKANPFSKEGNEK